MARAERLMDLADLLRGREATTVQALADELGVSYRTLMRDLAALRERGLPITGESGPGGGVRLEGERGVSAVHLSLAEVVAMWLAATLSRGASHLPWGDAARSGLAKLLSSMPREKARELRLLCRRVIIGPPASANVRFWAGAPPAELLGLFENAFSAGRGLGFHYVDREGKTSNRRIEPHGLLVQTPVWYVLARDIDKMEPRMFRMDRVSRPRLLADVQFKPDLELVLAQIPNRERWRQLSPS